MPLRKLTVHPQGTHVRDRKAHSRDNIKQKQYSIERLGALQTYTESSSMLRVLSIGIATIIAPLLTVLALDFLPLQPPGAGWDKNTPLWCRDFGMAFAAACGTLLQLQAMAPSADLTICKIACISFATACGFTPSVILLAKLWVFPIPFMMVVTMPFWIVFLLITTGCAIGVGTLRRNLVLKTQVLRFIWLITLEANLMVIYPVYSVVFASLSGWSQLALLFLLPAIKYIIKRLLKRAVADYEDLVPAIVITVDFFNALYQSKCMQSSGSFLATAGIIGLDMAQNILSLYSLFCCVRELEALANSDLITKGAIAFAIEIASRPSQLDTKELLKIRVSSCGHFCLSEGYSKMTERIRVLQDQVRRRRNPSTEASDKLSIENLPVRGGVDENVTRTRVECADTKTRSSSTTVATPKFTGAVKTGDVDVTKIKRSAPRWSLIFPHVAVHPVDAGAQPSRDLTGKEKVVVLKRTLELLWRCELILLVEYVEAAIPMMYAVYLAILHQLPNAKYYPDTVSMDSAHLQQAITSILIYGVLELVSLVCVHLVLKRRFKLSPLHQVAFTLESEWQLIQGAFTTWVVVVLPLTLEHHGADFTFHFAWLSA